MRMLWAGIIPLGESDVETRRLPFTVEATCPGTSARATRFQTLHNTIETPLFMPVGTHAVVRHQRFDELAELGAQMLLANTYHLLLRPGPDVFRTMGGYHGLTRWPRSVLTDSGGFQIFCLPNDRTITEEGAVFRSYVDGKKIKLTPELSIEMQRAIASDIMMVLDYCVPSTSTRELTTYALDVTTRWAKRSFAARGESRQALFGIVQGACFHDLRAESAKQLAEIDFDGFALGGLAVGETIAERQDTTEFTAALLPADKPRYLMGVGTPIDLLDAVHRGVDMFDCILPLSHAQQGVVYTSEGTKKLVRAKYREFDGPIDPACDCYTCRTYPAAYLHHILKVKEFNIGHLAGVHNLHFYFGLMREMRAHIFAGTFAEFYRVKRAAIDRSDGAD